MSIANFRFYTPRGFPVSRTRGVALGAELADSIAVLHGVEKVTVWPEWWRRICLHTRYVECGTGEHGELRVLVIVDPRPLEWSPYQLDADLVYELDTRHGTLIRLPADKPLQR